MTKQLLYSKRSLYSKESRNWLRSGPAARARIWGLILLVLVLAGQARATTFDVDVAPGGLFFSPSTVNVKAGDTVRWTWKGSGHSVTSGLPGGSSGLFDSGVHNSGFTFSFTFSDAGSFDYHCTPHGLCCNMVGKVVVAAATPTPTPTPTATPRPPSQAQLLNISTRMDVKTGDNVLIGGFIVTGNAAKKVVLRALGPSLSQFGIAGALADPILELHQSVAGVDTVIASDDNWKDLQQTEIEAAGFAPQDDLESAIVATLDPNASYTAIVRGTNGTSGVGLVEVFDLDQPADAQLANISTRGFVETGNNVMIGGFILGNGTGTTNVVIRGLGPSLSPLGVAGALSDPTLELHDANGMIVQSNDNWKDNSAADQAELTADQLAPTNDLESAMIVTLSTDAFTAIVSGKNGLMGVALVEVYRLP